VEEEGEEAGVKRILDYAPTRRRRREPYTLADALHLLFFASILIAAIWLITWVGTNNP
jgi:hypothetical protein